MTSIDTLRPIGWNGITLSCPTKWETFVSGHNHLLFEEDFRPIFELRWQKSATDKKAPTDPILRNLHREAGLYGQRSVPRAWQQIEKNYEIIPLADKQSNEAKGALLSCRHCNTSLLLYFFSPHAIQRQDLQQTLSSLNCHTPAEEDNLWAIQDFQIRIPDRFQLSSHSFAASLTRLSFTDSGLTMHICRLAQASLRLQTSSLADLMIHLSGTVVPETEIVHSSHGASYSNHPSIFRQVLTRFKREPSFHWMTLRHHPEHDRLSGLFLEDKKPIAEEQAISILNSYENLSL